jgi:hypothetical protein
MHLAQNSCPDGVLCTTEFFSELNDQSIAAGDGDSGIQNVSFSQLQGSFTFRVVQEDMILAVYVP